jgi:hypothetical protein
VLYDAGSSCEQVTDPCANAPCGVGATCEPVPAGHVNIYNLTYNCTVCATNFTLDLGKCVKSGKFVCYCLIELA